MGTKGFLKPQDEDFTSTWKEDKLDLEPLKETSFVYNSSPSLSLSAQRQKLPINKYKEAIIYMLNKFQTLVIVGETGSGKSTQIPQYLLEAGWSQEQGSMIGVSQPRRIAATTLASRVADERGCALGSTVGYSIRFDEKFSRTDTKIKYLTEGILIREMMGDPLLSNYSALILDEAHERTAQTDVIMGLLKKILKRRRDLNLIVSSATVDAEYIRDFFENSSILSVTGSSYSVDLFYLKDSTPNYVKEAMETARKIHKIEPPGDILIFLTGMEEVDSCVSLLKEYDKEPSKHGLRILALPMYGSLSQSDQLKVFRPSPRSFRKIIVATNIAETSITIDGISYVIDSCFVKLKWYDPVARMDSLVITEISKASAEQRRGRAGRTRPGKCYRLCTENHFDSVLKRHTIPEMQRSDLSSTILRLKSLGIDNVLRFEFPSAPPSKNLATSLELLCGLEALDKKGNLTRPLGERMSELSISPLLAKMLLSSGKFGCSQEIAAIVAMMQVEGIFLKHGGDKARIARRFFEVAQGDLLTYLNVFHAYKKEGESKHWCTTNFVRYKSLKRANELYSQLLKTLKRFQIPIKSCSASESDEILKCIVSGLFPNAAYLHHSGVYRTITGHKDLYINPTSCLYAEKPPSWIVFAELLQSNKVYMKDITVIQPHWLEVLAPHFYEKK